MGGGLLHNLRLIDRLDLIIDMRATVVNGRVIGSDKVSVLPSVTAGLAVDLGWPNFVRTDNILAAIEVANAEKTVILETAIAALEVANASLENQNTQLNKANKQLKNQVTALQNEVKTEPVTFFKDMSPAAIYFNIGQTVLDEKEMHHLDFLA